MSEFSLFYINNRYINYKIDLSKLVTKKNADDILTKTKEMFLWLLTLKP
jgi:hypothetical protein